MSTRPFGTNRDQGLELNLSTERFQDLLELLRPTGADLSSKSRFTGEMVEFLLAADEPERILLLHHLDSDSSLGPFRARDVSGADRTTLVSRAVRTAASRGQVWSSELDILARLRVWDDRQAIEASLDTLRNWVAEQDNPDEVVRLLNFRYVDVADVVAQHAVAITPDMADTLLQRLRRSSRGTSAERDFKQRPDLPDEIKEYFLQDAVEMHLESVPRNDRPTPHARRKALQDLLEVHGYSDFVRTRLWKAFREERDGTAHFNPRKPRMRSENIPPASDRAVPILTRDPELTEEQAEEILAYEIVRGDLSRDIAPVLLSRISTPRIRELLDKQPLRADARPHSKVNRQATLHHAADWRSSSLAEHLFRSDVELRREDPVLSREEMVHIGGRLMAADKDRASEVVSHPRADTDFWLDLLERAYGAEKKEMYRALVEHGPAVRDEAVRKELSQSRSAQVLIPLFQTSTDAEECEQIWSHLRPDDRKSLVLSSGPPPGVAGLKGPEDLILRMLRSKDEDERRAAFNFLPAMDMQPDTPTADEPEPPIESGRKPSR